MKQKVTNQTRRKMLIGGAAAASTPLWMNVASAQAEPIKIGFPTPLTGPFSAEAQDQVKAAELAKTDNVSIYTIGIGADRMVVNSFFGDRVVNPSTDLLRYSTRAGIPAGPGQFDSLLAVGFGLIKH